MSLPKSQNSEDDQELPGESRAIGPEIAFEIGPITKYETYREYVDDELIRVSHLAKAYFIRQFALSRQSANAIENCLESPFQWYCEIGDRALHCQWEQQVRLATTLHTRILSRLKLTPAKAFPLIRLIELYQLREQADRTKPIVSAELDILLLSILDYRIPQYRAAFSSIRLADGTYSGSLTVDIVAEIIQPSLGKRRDPLQYFHPNAKLVQNGLVAVGDEKMRASQRRIEVDPFVAEFVINASRDDFELNGSTTSYDAGVWDSVFIDTRVKDQLLQFGSESRGLPRPLVLLIHGPAGTPFVATSRALLPRLNRRSLLVADVGAGLATSNFARWVSRVYRNARLTNSCVLWNRATTLFDSSRTDDRWKLLMNVPVDVPVIIASENAWDPIDPNNEFKGTFARVDFPIPSVDQRRKLWEFQLDSASMPLPQDERPLALDLLQSFQFTQGQVVDAISIGRGLSAIEPPSQELVIDSGTAYINADSSFENSISELSTSENRRTSLHELESREANSPKKTQVDFLYDACRRVSAHGLISFTQRVPPRNSLKDLNAVVLGPEAKQLLSELNDRIGHLSEVYLQYGFGEQLSMGKGLVALFTGPSGTGKTLAATVLASANERDLYKVDMSAVVSKYVGETEKNLARIFSDAQSSNALLFFDEADAIFGKRGDVDKAQDRWANMEINFLLQRIEDFAGVVILASNLKQNIDEAFMRRVQVMIDFTPPDADARFLILSTMFPNNVQRPSDEELKAFTKKIDLNGGNLKNVAIDAAFRALSAHVSGQPLKITLEDLLKGAAREYRKLSRPVNMNTFGRDYFETVKAHGFAFEG